MKPFFSYYGGKYRLASKYPDPHKHTWLVEPFAGSAGFSTRWEHPNVVLCDADERISGVWRYLISAKQSEILQLPSIPAGGEIPAWLCEEARNLIGFWLTRGSAHPTFKMRQNPEHYLWWGVETKRRIASQLDAIRNWRVWDGPYQTMRPTGPAFWFVDPPYQKQGKFYRHSRVDYKHLAEWCRDLPGTTVVCEGEGADWLPFESLGQVKSFKGKAEEKVWVQRK